MEIGRPTDEVAVSTEFTCKKPFCLPEELARILSLAPNCMLAFSWSSFSRIALTTFWSDRSAWGIMRSNMNNMCARNEKEQKETGS
jgi:hypothetical protein